MNDNESIDALRLRTLYRNALNVYGVVTIGQLKDCIKNHDIDYIRRIGTSGKREIINAIVPKADDDKELHAAIEYYRSQYESYCKILNKNCPDNANVPYECDKCNLYSVYNDYMKRAIDMNQS